MASVDSEFTSRFGALLRSMRKARRLTQLGLAMALPVDNSVISRWENGGDHPDRGQLERLRQRLTLTEEEFENLMFAWKREVERTPILFVGELSRPSGLVDFTDRSITFARSMRKAGQPHIALQLCERDAQVVFDRIREQSWSSEHPRMLARLSELLVEQCKAGLDFLPRPEVRQGALSRTVNRLKLFADVCKSSDTTFFSELAMEGVTYVGGDVDTAFGQSMQFLEQFHHVPAGWRPEVLRAAAINAGRLNDRKILEQVEMMIERLLDDLAAKSDNGEAAFILEGLARGWAGLDHERGIKIVERAWDSRRAATGVDGASKLRYVQLVRSEAEVISSDPASADVISLREKVREALNISRTLGYERYVSQLMELLEELD